MIKSLLFVFIFAHLFYSLNIYAQEKIVRCNGSTVTVKYTEIKDYHLVCDSVKKVIEVARKIGINEEMNVSVSIVDKLSINIFGKSLAFFKPSTMEIQVLSMEACKKTFENELVLGLKFNKELYKSFIIHELAHALFWKNKGKNIIAREIHEYFAYIIQFVLLDEFHREQIIFSNDVPAFSNRSEISIEYYLMNPTRFAVKSYLHFINIKERWTYLRSLFKE